MLKFKGFTLVELLVVIVVIGILIALILPNALRAIRQANNRECASNIRSIDTAIQMFYTENRIWPAGLDDLRAYFPDEVVPTCPFGVAYTLETFEGGQRVNKQGHFANWPDIANHQ